MMMDNEECTSLIITIMLFISLGGLHGGLHGAPTDILKCALISALTGTIMTSIASWLYPKLKWR